VELAASARRDLDRVRESLGLDHEAATADDIVGAVRRREIQIWQALGEPEGRWPWEALVAEVEKLDTQPPARPIVPSLLDLDALERDARARLDVILQIKALAPVALGRAA
jgi:hypothetical protein